MDGKMTAGAWWFLGPTVVRVGRSISMRPTMPSLAQHQPRRFRNGMMSLMSLKSVKVKLGVDVSLGHHCFESHFAKASKCCPGNFSSASALISSSNCCIAPWISLFSSERLEATSRKSRLFLMSSFKEAICNSSAPKASQSSLAWFISSVDLFKAWSDGIVDLAMPTTLLHSFLPRIEQTVKLRPNWANIMSYNFATSVQLWFDSTHESWLKNYSLQ